MAIGSEASISMHSGDTRRLEVTVVDEASAAVDLTTASSIIWALSKKDADSVAPRGSSLVSKDIGSGVTVTDAVNGRVDVAIASADTAALAGDYYHEIQVTMGGDISTVLYGTVTIVKDLI
jgi:transcription elongation GreA/GreB family factor